MFLKIKSIILRIWGGMIASTAYAEKQFITLGVIGFLGYASYYVIWTEITPGAYNSLILRLIAMFLCMGLILKKYWLNDFRLKTIYWYFTLLYLFPFFFAFFLFKNNFNYIWEQNAMMALFWLILLTDWISLITLLALGILLAWFLYIFTSNAIYLPENIWGIIFTYAAVLTTGGFFIYNKDTLLKEKFKAVHFLSMNIAHELRTPLAAINLAADTTKEYLPELIQGYEAAKRANLLSNEINHSQLESIASSMNDIEAETNYSNMIINILLTNLDQKSITSGELKTCSIAHCVDEALRRYPFQSDERKLIHWKNDKDFLFAGKEMLTIHVLFNLIKNALYYIRDANKGEIHIWIEQDENYGRLYFKDTGKGISSNILPSIFNLFFSDTHHGTGIGLAYCKMVMESYKGRIECNAIEGEYAEFILTFPLIKNSL